MDLLTTAFVVALTTSSGACGQHVEPAVEAQPRLVTIAELAAKPAAYTAQSVRVRGRLENSGRNYFRDRRIVLSDGKGPTIEVGPWLPLSVPSAGGQAQTGVTLADFLDQRVELIGRLTRRTEPERSTEYIFQVTSAKILKT